MIHGFWYDGVSAARTEVEVRVVGRQLVLLEPGSGYTVLTMPVTGLRLAEDVYAGQPLRLICADHPEARLIVADHALLTTLRGVHPGLGRAWGRSYLGNMSLRQRFVLVGGFVLVCLVALVASVPYMGEEVAAAMPVEWERAAGEKIVTHISRDYGLCAGEEGLGALAVLVSRLALSSGYDPDDFVARVLDASMINAFAAPGGQIMLTRGLLADAENGEEVAAVLAHEMAHAVLAHPTRAIGRALGYRLLFAALLGDATAAAAMAGQAGETLLNRSYSREAELEADRLALTLLDNAGIDSRGLVSFFERRQRSRLFVGPRGSDILSTHPSFPARIEQASRYQRPGSAALDNRTWQLLKGICDEGSTIKSEKGNNNE